MRALILFSIVSTTLCCKKDRYEPFNNDGLIGKWKLIEVLSDPGDGSGRFQKVSEALSTVVEFKANGDFTETNGTIIPSRAPNDRYDMLDDIRIELKNRTNPSPSNEIWYIKEITPHTLVLGFSCYEPCGKKYIAVR